MIWLAGIMVASPAVVHASPPPADSVHFCAFGHERWRPAHPRPAAKGLANLDKGEPRTVRMVYFVPNDRPSREEVVDSMKTVIKRVQTFYAEQMQAHGYGHKTFRFETDALGEPLVHRVEGQHPDSHYLRSTAGRAVVEIEQAFDADANDYLIVVDHSLDAIVLGNGGHAGGIAFEDDKNSGYAVVPHSVRFTTVAHELGHTFGLQHDFRDDAYIMSYGGRQDRLSGCAAEFLAVHPYFNPAVPIEDGQPPTVELTSSNRYPEGSESVPVQLEVSDSDGVHQVILFATAIDFGVATGGSELKTCRGLAGETDVVVDFEYDGGVPSSPVSSLSDPAVHRVVVLAVDTDGDVSETVLYLAEVPQQATAFLEGHTGRVEEVSFSPDGTILASAAVDGTVRLWDVATRATVATLDNGPGVTALAFSPDGTTLASGAYNETVRLWDVASGEQIAVLGKHPEYVESLAFSLDGNTLVSGSGYGDSTIRLWDVNAREQIGALTGHTSWVNSLSFSPDRTTLASGASDGEVRLWDVPSRTTIATLEETSSITSVSFSPDGSLLAYGAFGGTVWLWDVASRAPVGTLEHPGWAVYSISFSPDGRMLACASTAGAVWLWDVASRTNLATLQGHAADLVYSVAFSPDGTTIASGSPDNTVILWDVSEWTRPRPSMVAVISGDGQQGVPGVALAQPLVVEVRDQYGDLLPEATVTFVVTAGEGRLSDRFTVEHATTDADGRAELILTLGPQPGPNIVGVSLGGHDLATFTADGVGTAVAELEGDYRTWHLPAGASARFGKGAIGEGDRAVALSADGRWLAVASAVGVWLYEAATSRAQTLLPSAIWVHSVAFSLDGTLAAGLDNGRIELWEVESGERVGTLQHGWGGGLTVVFSPDGTRLASRWRQEIKLWDVGTEGDVGHWEVPTDIHGHRHGAGRSVAFSPDGTRLAAGFQDGTVRLWDVATRTEVATLEGHTDWVLSVAFSLDGSHVASTGGREDPTVRLWEVSTQTEVATLRGHKDRVMSVSFSPDGATLASGSSDRTVRLWDVATHGQVAIWEDHGDAIRSVAFPSDGVTLVSAAADGTVLVRDLETGNAAGLSGHASLSSMALSSDGALLASGYPDGTVRLWDSAARTRIATLEGHDSEVESVSFSPDGATLASGSRDRKVMLWDVGTRKLAGTLEGHTGPVTSVAFSPDGATLASAGGWGDATVRLWDVATRELIEGLEGHTISVQAVAFSPPDGATLASGGGYEDRTVKLWDVATRTEIATLEGHEYEINAVAFSPDGSTLASGSGGSRTLLWDVGTRTQIVTLPATNTVWSVAFSPDGKSLVSGSYRSVELWNLTTKQRSANLRGHTGSVHSLAFSRDGATLASGASDGTMLLWDLRLHPGRLTKVPGRNQQGPAGAALDRPFVVLVLDQHRNPLPGATVTFAVTAGGGTLSVATATTDADGRAATTLTLGPEPGTNTVEATVDGLEPVTFTAAGRATATTLDKLSGDEQQGPVGTSLGEPFVVEVRDHNGNPHAGAAVIFSVTAGGGTLSVRTIATDANGRASTTLTLGSEPVTNTVRARVPGLEPVTFTATAEATPDFDGDGEVDFSDFFVFAEAFGGSDPRFDLDGSGTVDFADFFLFAESFGQPARARLLALAWEQIGLPDGPQLRQNAPNPFNSGTVISWFQLQGGPARLEVYALTGQRVAVLQEGPKKAGLHRLRWDGRDSGGRVMASGVYLYRLVTAEGTQTRKLTLLR